MKYFAFLALVALSFAACKDDHDHSTEEENITTITVQITGNGTTLSFTANDSDGDAVFNTIDTIKLAANVNNYSSTMKVLDRSEATEVDLTSEIQEESNEHLFTYSVSGPNGLAISNLNKDAAGNPFGLTTTWATGAAGTGSVTIRLFHEPTDKNNASSPGGETDFEVTFPVRVQ
jgi:hypothetical protein